MPRPSRSLSVFPSVSGLRSAGLAAAGSSCRPSAPAATWQPRSASPQGSARSLWPGPEHRAGGRASRGGCLCIGQWVPLLETWGQVMKKSSVREKKKEEEGFTASWSQFKVERSFRGKFGASLPCFSVFLLRFLLFPPLLLLLPQFASFSFLSVLLFSLSPHSSGGERKTPSVLPLMLLPCCKKVQQRKKGIEGVCVCVCVRSSCNLLALCSLAVVFSPALSTLSLGSFTRALNCSLCPLLGLSLSLSL